MSAAVLSHVLARVDRRLRPRWVRGACAVVILVCTALFAVSFFTAHRGRTVFGPAPGADFAAFYTAGVMLEGGAGGGVYDFWGHYRQLPGLFPALPADEALPFAYPPFFGAVFRPLARLPYPMAFGMWTL